jgi:nucleotide-binding universal stress UspA family protein
VPAVGRARLSEKEVDMFKTVIWATDGSAHAERALPLATALVDPVHGRIVVLHVYELLVGRAGGQPVYADEEEILEGLRERAEELREKGFTVDFKVVTTFDVNAAKAIAEEACELEADVIVVGTHGRGALASALHGSVTQKLLRVADCPVLAVPPHLRVLESELV